MLGDSGGVPGPSSRLKFEWLLYPLLLIAAMAIYYPRAKHNLPVAINVDDRTSLAVLLRFHQGSANPKFFMYPTLYYYLTYALTAGFGFARILLTGHLLNLGLIGVTAGISYRFCVRHFRSRGAGLVAAGCVLFSPTMVASGTYLCTDILLSAMTILSVSLLIGYFESGSSRDWLLAMLAVGCAIATKYTAAILFVAYFVVELVQSYRRQTQTAPAEDGAEGPHFARSTVSLALIALCVACGLIAVFFPVNRILHFVALHRTNLDPRSQRDYLFFLNRLRQVALELCIGSAVLLALTRWSRTAYECISSKRPYFGVVILLGVFVITTPYSVLDPGKFIYDLGALLRANVVVPGTHQQWSNYCYWLFDDENAIAVILGILGLGLMIVRVPWRSLSASLYLGLYVLTICSSHLGTPRYLNPALPLLYCGTGLMMQELWSGLPHIAALDRCSGWWRSATLLLGVLMLGGMIRTVEQDDRAAAQHDAFYASYAKVLQMEQQYKLQQAPAAVTGGEEPATVLYAGFTPSVELGLAGVRMQPLSWPGLEEGGLGEHLPCNDLLILNMKQAAANHIYPQEDPSVDLLLEDTEGAGQMVVRRRGC